MTMTTKTPEIPTKMTAWMAHKEIPHEKLGDAEAIAKACRLEEVDVPTPQPGQVLIRVHRGTVSPNDLLHMLGRYVNTDDIPYPRPLGFEGAGVVVASRASYRYAPAATVGARVAFYQDRGGVFGEYTVMDAMKVIPIPNNRGISMQVAASSVTNPMTAVVMVDQVKARGHKVFINTAAAGSLGKLILRYAKTVGVEVICVVHRDEQEEICCKEGAKYVVNSSKNDFVDQLSTVMKETKCTFAYDCISGPMPRLLLKAASPAGLTVSIYGVLSGQSDTFEAGDSVSEFVTANKSVEKFNLAKVLENMWFISLVLVIRKVSNGMGGIFLSKFQKAFPLSELPDAYAYYTENMTKGKIQIVATEEYD